MSVLIAYAVPVFLALLVIESRVRRAGARGYERRDTAASLATTTPAAITTCRPRCASPG